MSSTGGVYTLGPLLNDYTLQAIANAKKTREIERQKKIEETKNKFVNKDGLMVDATLNNMDEIKGILKKAGIKQYFPFAPVKNDKGEIDFIPKGKNLKEIKEDIDAYKEKMQEALDKGKITQEEFEKLEQNLDELVEKNEIDLEEAENLEVTDAEINDYVNAIIYRNFGDADKKMPELEEQYLNSDLESKENFLNKFNREVNVKLGTDFKWSHQPGNIPFERSFNEDGKSYTLSTSEIDINRTDVKDVNGDHLRNILYGMVERSLIMKHQMQNQVMSPEKKKELHNKIMKDKAIREREQEKYNRKQAQIRIRRLERE